MVVTTRVRNESSASHMLLASGVSRSWICIGSSTNGELQCAQTSFYRPIAALKYACYLKLSCAGLGKRPTRIKDIGKKKKKNVIDPWANKECLSEKRQI